MRGLNAKREVVVYEVDFIKKLNLLAYFCLIPQPFTPCILIYLYGNASDLTLPQIT